MKEYNASDIVVLKSFEAVRRRPGMYIGNPEDGSGMHHLLWELLGNGIDEHLRGGISSYLRVEIEGETVTVEDDGRGIPVDPVPRQPGMTTLELVFTALHGGSSHFGGSPHVHLASSLHGCGLAPVTALSRHLEVVVWRDGRSHGQSYAAGEPLGPVRDLGPAGARTGTRVAFTPDFAILRRHPWDREAIARKLRELAAMNARLTAILDHDAFRSPDGLADHVRYLAGGDRRLHPAPIRLLATHDDTHVEVAILWTDRARARVQGFVSQGPTAAGTHIDGLYQGLRCAFEAAAPDRFRRVHDPAFREAVERGLVAVVHAGLYHPRFGNPSRDRLLNPETRDAVAAVVAAGLADQFARDPALLARLLARMPG